LSARFRSPEGTGSAPPLSLLYEDADLVAIDKPPWSVIHPTRGASDALVLLEALSKQTGAPVFPVHRLDRQTSGALVFARTAAAASLLSEQIRSSLWKKTYVGLCRGVLLESLRIDRPVPQESAYQPAQTDIDPLEHFCARYSLVEARPMTGRHHQIRYHLKHASHPLVGDASYGQGSINRFFRETLGLGRLFLHARDLRLPHPVHNRYVELHAPLPPDLEEVLARLRVHTGEVP
jgi:tRNA pseudouridine65 synthase